ETEDARRLKFRNLVRGAQGDSGDVALQDRLTVEHVENVSRESHPATPNADVFRQAEVELERIRLPIGRDVRIDERIDVITRTVTVGVRHRRSTDSKNVRDDITLTAGQVHAEGRLDHRDLIGAGDVVGPLRVDIDAALRTAAVTGAYHD